MDGGFDMQWRIGVEVPEAAAEEGRGPHLPEQPVERFRAGADIARQKGAELLRQIDEDRARLEDPNRFAPALRRIVHQCRDLGVRVDADKAGAELVTVSDPDEPGVVFGLLVAGGQKLLQHDRDLLAVRRAERIELQRVLADRQGLFMRGAGNRTVDAGERAATLAVPGPYLRRDIAGRQILFGRGFFEVGNENHILLLRSEERRVGKESVRTSRYRRVQYH